MKALHAACLVFMFGTSQALSRDHTDNTDQEVCKVGNEILTAAGFLRDETAVKQTGLAFGQHCEGDECYLTANIGGKQLAAMDFSVKLQRVEICRTQGFVEEDEDAAPDCLRKYYMRTTSVRIQPPRPDAHYSNVTFVEAIPTDRIKGNICYSRGSDDGPTIRVFTLDSAGDGNSKIYVTENDAFTTSEGAFHADYPFYLQR